MNNTFDRFAPTSPDDWATRNMTRQEKAAYYAAKCTEQLDEQHLESIRADISAEEKE